MSDRIGRFLVTSGQVVLETSAPAGSVYIAGARINESTGAVLAEEGGTVLRVLNGLGFGASDALEVVDASGGLPSGTVYLSGLPFYNDRLCVDGSGAVAYYVYGLPFSAVGALCVTGLTIAGAIVTEGGDTVVTEGGDTVVVE